MRETGDGRIDPQQLRAALLGNRGANTSVRWYAPRRQRLQAPPAAAVPVVMTPERLLSEAPAARRLCESYHRIRGGLLARSRRQRIGVGAMVAAVGTLVTEMVHRHRFSSDAVEVAVVALAVVAALGVMVLTLLAARELRRATARQAERLLRGLAVNGVDDGGLLGLGQDALELFLSCYAVWQRCGRVEAMAA